MQQPIQLLGVFITTMGWQSIAGVSAIDAGLLRAPLLPLATSAAMGAIALMARLLKGLLGRMRLACMQRDLCRAANPN